jgi:hypothetical protein
MNKHKTGSMKKGQLTETLLYVAGGIIAALAIYYGVSSIGQLGVKGEEASLALLKNTIRNNIATISTHYGSNKTYSYNLGSDYTQICFSDTTKNSQIANDQLEYVISPGIIRDSAESNSTNNIFLLGPKTEAFYGGEIRVCMKNVSCFNASMGMVDVRMYGGGSYALFEPCEIPKVSIPFVINWTVPKDRTIETYDLPYTISDIFANATDPGGSELDLRWIVKNISADIINETSKENQPSSVIEGFGAFNVTSYGRYYFTLIATNNISRQGSFTFTREVVQPGEHYPEARILVDKISPPLPVQLGVSTGFVGYGNDLSPGELNESWDWGDGNAYDCALSVTRVANQSYNCTKLKAYYETGVSRLIKFKVTNIRTGLSATDSLRITIGNTAPWIVLSAPDNGQVLTTNANTMDVAFNFTPYDNEQSSISCQINIDGSVTSLGNRQNATLQTFTKTMNAPAVNGAEETHHWAVSCNDGIDSNSSETRTFKIRRVAQLLPELSCFVSDDCRGSTAMLSISDLTNAHVSSNVNDYTYKLCCNLTVGGDPANYLEKTTSCANPFISLSSATNAHASFRDPLYTASQICFSKNPALTQPLNFNCYVNNDCATDICILTLSSNVPGTYTNSHVAACTQPYSNKICCNVTAG